MPARSNGICCAALASRPHKARVVWSAHCRSSITRMVGRTAHCSVTSASTCSASTPGSAGISPRSCRMIIFRRGFTEGSRTRSPSRNGCSGNAWESSSAAPQNTSQRASGAPARADRTSADLPMPGSPSMSTEPPRPRATSLTSPASSAISRSRPISASALVTACMYRTLLAGLSCDIRQSMDVLHGNLQKHYEPTGDGLTTVSGLQARCRERPREGPSLSVASGRAEDPPSARLL